MTYNSFTVMKKLVLMLAASLGATALMAQQQADTIQVASLDSVPTQVFQLPENFQGDTAYNHVFKSPNGMMQVSGSYHVGKGCEARMQEMRVPDWDKMPMMEFPGFPEFPNFPAFPEFRIQMGPRPHMCGQQGQHQCQQKQLTEKEKKELQKKHEKAQKERAKQMKKRAKIEKKRRIQAIKDYYKFGPRF